VGAERRCAEKKDKTLIAHMEKYAKLWHAASPVVKQFFPCTDPDSNASGSPGFHTSPFIPDVGVNFDAAVFAKNFQEGAR